jgi:mitochondrial fission protein ELM1
MERPDRPPTPVATADAVLWTLTDGHAGNVRQTTALALSLGMAVARDLHLQARWPWRLWAPLCAAGSDQAFGKTFRSALDEPPALAIGCGRQAALATRLLRRRGARVVQILDPRLDPRHWDLVVAPRHDRVHGANVLSLLGSLNPVDDLWLAQARAMFPAMATLPQPRTTVLLGGSSRHANLTHRDFLQLAEHVRRSCQQDGGSVLLTVSRRTPAALHAHLRQMFVDVPGCLWTGAADGDNPYPGMLAWADRIVCSPDSVNMISEACATNAPVHVFEPQRTRGRLQDFLATLLSSGRIRELRPALAAFDITPLRETARIAAEIRQRLNL